MNRIAQPRETRPAIPLDEPIYAMSSTRRGSMHDLLRPFVRHGTSHMTDLHLKVGLPPVYRVDGQLKITNGQPLDDETIHQLARTLLTEPEMETLETLRSVNSSQLIDGLRFRINAFHDRKGLAIAIRALDMNTPTIAEIGFPNRVWEDIVNLRQGLVLLVGTTGSGKSTTIAALIHHIARTRPCHIITLEDPIEYQLDSDKAIVSQRAIGRDVPNYERGLRDCLREDPDVIFVGEMTDQESTNWTLTAAETGHLVFSSLHTRDATGTIIRLLDLYPPNRAEEVAHQLSLSLRYVIAQKLLPRQDRPGRVVAMEILNNTYAVANLLRQVRPEHIYSIMQTQNRDEPRQRMRTMERSLVELVKAGIVDEQEAERAANRPTTFTEELARGG